MKLNLILILGVLSLSAPSYASIVCEAVKKTVGAHVVRGVKLSSASLKFEETEWFGTDSEARDQAGRACWTAVRATACTATAPHASDRYMNVGDPGFGPRMYVEKSTKAGILTIQWLPVDLQSHFPSDSSELHGRYFAFFSGCEDARINFVHGIIESLADESARKHREEMLRDSPSYEGSAWRMVP